jgi:hypothetical protein
MTSGNSTFAGTNARRPRCWPPNPRNVAGTRASNYVRLTSSNEVTETSSALPLFKAALPVPPQMDSIYVGFEDGA